MDFIKAGVVNVVLFKCEDIKSKGFCNYFGAGSAKHTHYLFVTIILKPKFSINNAESIK